MPRDQKDSRGPDLYRRGQFQDDYVEEEEDIEELMDAFGEEKSRCLS